MLMSIAKNHFNWTLEKIWDYFGGKNHTAVIYACRNFEKKLKKDKIISHDYAVVVDRLN
jgi:chromosomal replication initiation ATPase DnaA